MSSRDQLKILVGGSLEQRQTWAMGAEKLVPSKVGQLMCVILLQTLQSACVLSFANFFILKMVSWEI